MKYVNEAYLRGRLSRELAKGKTQGDVAREAGVSRPAVSMSLSGRYPFNAQLAAHLGYRRVRESLFQRESA